MAEWYTPTQVQRALESVWTKLEKSTAPPTVQEIKDEDLINYYGTTAKVDQRTKRFQYDLVFNTNKLYDPKMRKDGCKSHREICDDIYAEENRRTVPLVSSHLHGHWRTDLEGWPLRNYKKVEDKSEYRRTGLPFNRSLGLPKSNSKQYSDES